MLARCGCDVAIVDVNQTEAERVAGIVRSHGRRAVVLKADVRSLTEMEAAAAECVYKLGGLDICVANAGIVRTGSILTMDEKRWHEIMDVNMTGTFLTVRACSREMVKLNRRIDSPTSHHTSSGVGGRIITISSANAVLAGAEGGAYCATKAGVSIMTRCWAQDLIAHDITVNCIGPGATDTGLMRAQVDSAEAHTGLLKLIPSGRMAEPEEVGWLVAFYASPAAAYLTGNFTLMDGGLRDHNAELTPALHETRALRAKLNGQQVRTAPHHQTADSPTADTTRCSATYLFCLLVWCCLGVGQNRCRCESSARCVDGAAREICTEIRSVAVDRPLIDCSMRSVLSRSNNFSFSLSLSIPVLF